MKKWFILFLSAAFGLTACSTFKSQSTSTQPAPVTTVNKMSTTRTTANPTSISANDNSSMLTATRPAANADLGGNIANSMDSIDKGKFSHALDSPLGKATTWTNTSSGVQFTVVAIQKVTINANPYCRKYTLTATRGQRTRQTQGTACVNANSSWQAI